MTKTEKEKCEQLVEEAITKCLESKEEYKNWESCKKNNDSMGAHLVLRKADQDYGYAEGIHQALAVIGYSSVSMEELSDLI